VSSGKEIKSPEQKILHPVYPVPFFTLSFLVIIEALMYYRHTPDEEQKRIPARALPQIPHGI
jgi:hypothetical protein